MRYRCLWLARELPFPEDSGDRIHSARLALALARAGAEVCFVGHERAEHDDDDDAQASEPSGPPPVHWIGVAGGRRGLLRSLASSEPLQSARHATPRYRRTVQALLRERWDAVVLDHYGSSWLHRLVRQARAGADAPALRVHLSHNHEASLWRGLVAGYEGPPLKHAALWLNQRRIARCEQRLAAGVHLLCCITPEDAAAFAAQGVRTPSLVVSPGYSGTVAPPRTIDEHTPRHVLLLGSYRWIAKQHNLRALAAAADAAFTRHGIVLDVVGDAPPELRAALAGCRALRLHGFADSLAPFTADARLALVPEAIGGGFKLKLLDYVFHRVPVVSLDAASAGLPPALRERLLHAPDLPGLVDTVLRHIDDLPLLNRLQAEAFDIAQSAFDWNERGQALLAAMRQAQPGGAPRAPGHPKPVGSAPLGGGPGVLDGRGLT